MIVFVLKAYCVTFCDKCYIKVKIFMPYFVILKILMLPFIYLALLQLVQDHLFSALMFSSVNGNYTFLSMSQEF